MKLKLVELPNSLFSSMFELEKIYKCEINEDFDTYYNVFISENGRYYGILKTRFESIDSMKYRLIKESLDKN